MLSTIIETVLVYRELIIKRYVDQYSNKVEKDYLDQANILTGGKVTYTIGK